MLELLCDSLIIHDARRTQHSHWLSADLCVCVSNGHTHEAPIPTQSSSVKLKVFPLQIADVCIRFPLDYKNESLCEERSFLKV